MDVCLCAVPSRYSCICLIRRSTLNICVTYIHIMILFYMFPFSGRKFSCANSRTTESLKYQYYGSNFFYLITHLGGSGLKLSKFKVKIFLYVENDCCFWAHRSYIDLSALTAECQARLDLNTWKWSMHWKFNRKEVKQDGLGPPRDVVRQNFKALGDPSAYSLLESINFTCNGNEAIVEANLQASISTNV